MSEWERFFNDQAPGYKDAPFTKNTVAEINFLLEVFNLPPGSRILDVGCGLGRHSIELARRGYKVTGIDFSAAMLEGAAKAAKEAGVEVEWLQVDATRFTSPKLFDAAICLCESAFGLLGLEDDPTEHDLDILRNIHIALKPGARFILTALNGFSAIRRLSQADVESGRFNPLTLVETFTKEWQTPEGKKSILVKERRYLPSELARYLRQVGFSVEHVWGGSAGRWARRTLELDEAEIMIVARKAGRTI